MLLKRPRYFNGQLLTAKDFEDEQAYQREKRQLHNRLLHGAGIVAGLDVSIELGTGDATVVVSPGFAIDRVGNEILVDCAVRVEIGICSTDACFVGIQYKEVPTDPVPTANGIEFSRVSETFSVEIIVADPSENPQHLGLARLIQQRGEWLLDETYSPPRLHTCH
jgi:hypothetical protein